MERVYFFPNISELFVGYECEVIDMGNYKKENRLVLPHKTKITGITDSNIWFKADGRTFELEDISQIRTPYLNSDDIIAEGWVYSKKHSNYTFGAFHSLTWLEKVEVWCINFWGYTVYCSEIKSINELRTLQRLLEIK